MPTHPEHRPLKVVLAQQPVCGLLHEHEVVELRTDSSHQPKDQLDKERCLDCSLIDEIGQVIEMAHVVAFVLKLRPAVSECLEDVADIPERVAKDVIVGVDDIVLLPRMLPAIDPLCRRKKGEINRSHVE